MKSLTVCDLFSGIGGFSLAAERARTESDYSVCYRILDTRFFGIPQRRRRIFLVASLGTECRPEILFERESLRGNIEACTEARQDPHAFVASGFGEYRQSRNAATLTAKKEYRLTSGESFVLFENHAQDSRVKEVSGCPTITSRAGTGGGNLPLVLHASQDPIVSDKHVHALGASSKQAVCIPIDTRNAVRDGGNQGMGIGEDGDPAFTSTTARPHGVFDSKTLRRLTPKECERLQGFPDDWTKILNLPWRRGKIPGQCPDGPRYKGCGNAITVDVGEWVLVGVGIDAKQRGIV